MKKDELLKASKALEMLAQRDGVSVEYVKKQIQIAMIAGMSSSDPDAQAFWQNLPHEGDIPTPEECIAYISGNIRKDRE
ncbi:hypothetical protein [Anaerotignum sp.]|uniref:hypothetical protein n=1 Tax=Anaerotignum sp. TaxID=2039241 RepID=UPI0028A647B8|nr:hypothetical protein [Anaerotignum sp.]